MRDGPDRRWAARLVVAQVAVVAVVAGALVWALASPDDGGSSVGGRPAGLPEGQVTATPVGRVDGVPTGLADDGSRLLVSLQEGQVVAVPGDGSDGAAEPVLDLRPVTHTDADDGLLGVALSPGGGWLLVDRNDVDDGLVVEAYPYDQGHAIGPDDGHRLLRLQRPGGDIHWGGDLAFAGDGTLFVAVGDQDLTSPRDEQGSVVGGPAQDPGAQVGAVLAMGFDERSGRVEQDPAAVAYGLRNPWRISVDPGLGDLWIGDVGEDHVEEVDRVRGADLGGEPVNFGWPLREGRRPGLLPGDPANGVAPLLARTHGRGVCGIVGGDVYRGDAIAALRGAYLYGDLCSSEVRALVPRAGRAPLDAVVATTSEPPITFGQDRAGELYVLGAGGGIFRLDEGRPADAPPVVACDQLCLEPRLVQGDQGEATTPACAVVAATDELAQHVADPQLTYVELDAALRVAARSLRRLEPDVAEERRADVKALVGLLDDLREGARSVAATAGQDQPASGYVQRQLGGAASREVQAHIEAIAGQTPDC